MTCVAVLQARMGSQRLPGKVLADLQGKPMLARIIERLKSCREVDRIVVAATTLPDDAEIAAVAAAEGACVYRGAVDDLVDRVRQAVLSSGGGDLVLHCTGDNPLVEPELADMLILSAKRSGADFTFMPGVPVGSGSDVYRMETLDRIDREAASAAAREHLNAWVFDHRDHFRVEAVAVPQKWQAPALRLTVDHPEDLSLVREIHTRLGEGGKNFNLADVVELMRLNPALAGMNAHIGQQYVSANAAAMRQGTTA